ncbi:MAG: lipopolysaccharide biosynthesis protein [Chitinophagaceae bacterium]
MAELKQWSKVPLYSKFKSFGKNEENKELIKHSLLALIIRVGGAGAAFIMNIIIARYLGASEAGYFFLAVSITTLVAGIGRIGADQTILRFVSIHSEKKEWGEVNAVMKKMLSWTYLPLIGLTALICIFSQPISIYIFHKEELRWPLFFTALAMPFFAGYNVYGMALQGRRRVVESVTVLKILTPVFFIIFVLIFAPKNSANASVYYAAACIFNLIAGLFWWNKNIKKTKEKKDFDSAVLWKSCWPLWISFIMQQLTIWGGQLVAGIFLSSKEVAQLAVGRNITVLVSFILLAVNNVSSPRIAAMYNQGQTKKLKNYVRNASRLMTIVALPITLLIWFFPSLIMSLFGKGFAEGSIWILRILAIGQFFAVISGNVGTLLVMSGHERDLKNNRIINGVMAVVLAFILTPLFGVVGSAISTAISMALFNILCVGYVKKRLGISTLDIFGFK